MKVERTRETRTRNANNPNPISPDFPVLRYPIFWHSGYLGLAVPQKRSPIRDLISERSRFLLPCLQSHL